MTTLDERNDRMLSQLIPTSETTEAVCRLLEVRFAQALQAHEAGEVHLLQSQVDVNPKIRPEAGLTYNVLEIGHSFVSLREVVTTNDRQFQIKHNQKGETCCCEKYTLQGTDIDLLDPRATASVLLDAIEKVTRSFLGVPSGDTPSIELVVVSGFPLDVMTLQSAFFREVFPDHEVEDPLNGVDLARLVVIGLERRRICVSLTAVVFNSIATVLAGAADKTPFAPRCLASASIDKYLKFAVRTPNPEESDFHGALIDVDFSRFSGWSAPKTPQSTVGGTPQPASYAGTILPLVLADLEVAFTQDGQQVGQRLLEKLVVGRFMPEVIRRSLLDVYQHGAPQKVWVRDTLTFQDCLAILNSKDESVAQRVVAEAWDWGTDATAAAKLKALVSAVFNRSASLLAVCIATLCKHTGRLQPALGGVSVCLTGHMLSSETYRNMLRMHVDDIFNKDTSSLIKFICVDDAPAKGAAVLAYRVKNKL